MLPGRKILTDDLSGQLELEEEEEEESIEEEQLPTHRVCRIGRSRRASTGTRTSIRRRDNSDEMVEYNYELKLLSDIKSSMSKSKKDDVKDCFSKQASSNRRNSTSSQTSRGSGRKGKERTANQRKSLSICEQMRSKQRAAETASILSFESPVELSTGGQCAANLPVCIGKSDCDAFEPDPGTSDKPTRWRKPGGIDDYQQLLEIIHREIQQTVGIPAIGCKKDHGLDCCDCEDQPKKKVQQENVRLDSVESSDSVLDDVLINKMLYRSKDSRSMLTEKRSGAPRYSEIDEDEGEAGGRVKKTRQSRSSARRMPDDVSITGVSTQGTVKKDNKSVKIDSARRTAGKSTTPFGGAGGSKTGRSTSRERTITPTVSKGQAVGASTARGASTSNGNTNWRRSTDRSVSNRRQSTDRSVSNGRGSTARNIAGGRSSNRGRATAVRIPIIPDYLFHNEINASSTDRRLGPASLSQLQRKYQDVEDENGPVGALLASKAFVQLACTPLVGYLVGVCGCYVPLLVGSCNMLLAAILFACGSSYKVLVLARALHGSASAATAISGMCLLAKKLPAELRVKLMPMAFGGIALGVLIGYPLGGAAYQAVGKSAPFILLAVCIALVIVLQVVYLKEEHGESEISEESYVKYLEVFRDRRTVIAALVISISTSTMAILEPCVPMWLLAKFDPPPSKWQLGAVFIPDSVGYFVGSHFTGLLAVVPWRIAVIAMVVTGLSCYALPLATALSQLTLPHFGIGLGVGAVDAALVPLLASFVDNKGMNEYGPIYSLQQAAVSVSYSLGPLIGGQTVQMLGFPWLIRIVGFLNLLVCPLLLELEAKTESVPLMSDSASMYDRLEDERELRVTK
ncbi:unnamed protein product [Phyllotreta striolata]|uniref:Synaptic vesicular amine transporter n=1 Tax=Phyllotreta striolata TaxID=444603 RepID=A0A9N9XLN0_PHYSR|nr:unnamed protein product [Phyllotreta striolata]